MTCHDLGKTHQEAGHTFWFCGSHPLLRSEDRKEWVPILSHGHALYDKYLHCVHQCETPLVVEWDLSRNWSIYSHFWGGILVTENAVGCFSFFRCLHCWMKSSIHHQAPKTLQFQSLRSNAWQKSRCLMLMLSQRKTPERVFFFYKKMNASQSLENMRNLTLGKICQRCSAWKAS